MRFLKVIDPSIRVDKQISMSQYNSVIHINILNAENEEAKFICTPADAYAMAQDLKEYIQSEAYKFNPVIAGDSGGDSIAFDFKNYSNQAVGISVFHSTEGDPIKAHIKIDSGSFWNTFIPALKRIAETHPEYAKS